MPNPNQDQFFSEANLSKLSNNFYYFAAFTFT